jgi:hypothetical protein
MRVLKTSLAQALEVYVSVLIRCPVAHVAGTVVPISTATADRIMVSICTLSEVLGVPPLSAPVAVGVVLITTRATHPVPVAVVITHEPTLVTVMRVVAMLTDKEQVIKATVTVRITVIGEVCVVLVQLILAPSAPDGTLTPMGRAGDGLSMVDMLTVT